MFTAESQLDALLCTCISLLRPLLWFGLYENHVIQIPKPLLTLFKQAISQCAQNYEFYFIRKKVGPIFSEFAI